LNLAVSRDGRSIPDLQDPGRHAGEYSYPAMCSGERRLLMTYTWHRETIKFVRLSSLRVPQD